MQQSTRDQRLPPTLDDVPSDATPPSAGDLYRRHLDRFPERPTDSALERAARALLRAAQLRLKAPPRNRA